MKEMAKQMGAVDENGEIDMAKLQELTKGMMGEDGKPDMSKMGGLFGGGGGMPSTDTSSAEEVD